MNRAEVIVMSSWVTPNQKTPDLHHFREKCEIVKVGRQASSERNGGT